MAESATLGTPAVQTEPDVVAAWPLGEILRDIARGGIAGLAVGIVVGGLGGRVAMRLIALLIPESTGSFTENGNRIGDITLGGSFALIVFGGLFVGIFVATIWVVVSPWLPRSLGLRVLAAIPLAIGLGAFGVDRRAATRTSSCSGTTPACSSCSSAWSGSSAPRWRSSTRGSTGACRALGRRSARRAGSTSSIALIGSFFAVGSWPPSSTTKLRPVGIALLVSGIATLRWWYLRYRGAERPPQMLRVLGSGGVIAAVVLGFALLCARHPASVASSAELQHLHRSAS